MVPTALLLWLVLLPAPGFPQFAPPSGPSSDRAPLITAPSSPGDVETGGQLAGLPLGATRWVRHEDLPALPQETHTVSEGANFKGQTEISGVALTTLARLFGQAAHSNLIVAICCDRCRSDYDQPTLAALTAYFKTFTPVRKNR